MVRQHSSIRFAHDDEVFMIPIRNEYSEQEIRDCWFSTSKEQKILHQHFNEIQKMEQGTGKQSSHRGLKFYTDMGANSAERRRLYCIGLVMDEHDINDSKKLRNLSKKAAKDPEG
ncbi:unnamed protein product [Cylindrotheca closterium]|uniref:Uncharacterized protein n=1 Tax=Cylindrotheca closterium TaxID=2856 RepID=A0AAD2CY75_9STRA|nr:unnamed protein product [Cylindrotheca closterium]